MRRQDTIATGGSIRGIASRLKQVALRVGNDPARIRKHIEAEIATLHEELDQLEAGRRPQPDATDCYNEGSAIALQMERLITDIGQYGTIIRKPPPPSTTRSTPTSSTATGSARCIPTTRRRGILRAATATAPSCG